MAKKRDVAPMRLRGNLFLEYRAALAELSEHRALVDLAQIRFNSERAKPVYDPLLRLQADLQSALMDAGKVQSAFKQLQSRVAKKFGKTTAEFNQFTINQHSGMIVFTPPQE